MFIKDALARKPFTVLANRRSVNRRSVASVLVTLLLFVPLHLNAVEKVTIAHSVQLSATIAPLLYGIHRGFFRDENVDLEYRMLRTDIGVKAIINK
jgi:ABC-type nitrate/sulfonate/bicarbonate transport system substrate-binding protein